MLKAGSWKPGERHRTHLFALLIVPHFCASLRLNHGVEFVRRLKKLGRRIGISVRYDARRGKGSHGRVYYGDRYATIIGLRHEIGPKLLRVMCRQLGIDPRNL